MEEMRKLDYIFHEHKGKPECKDCEFFILSKTLGSPDKPIRHCKSGLKPHNDKNGCCVDMCAMNVILGGGIK